MKKIFLLLGVTILTLSCKQKETIEKQAFKNEVSDIIFEKPPLVAMPDGMVWIPKGPISRARWEEINLQCSMKKSAHWVTVSGFFMNKTEMTNPEFRKFVNETGYVTVAEREINGKR